MEGEFEEEGGGVDRSAVEAATEGDCEELGGFNHPRLCGAISDCLEIDGHEVGGVAFDGVAVREGDDDFEEGEGVFEGELEGEFVGVDWFGWEVAADPDIEFFDFPALFSSPADDEFVLESEGNDVSRFG